MCAPRGRKTREMQKNVKWQRNAPRFPPLSSILPLLSIRGRSWLLSKSYKFLSNVDAFQLKQVQEIQKESCQVGRQDQELCVSSSIHPQKGNFSQSVSTASALGDPCPQSPSLSSVSFFSISLSNSLSSTSLQLPPKGVLAASCGGVCELILQGVATVLLELALKFSHLSHCVS